MQMSNPTPHTTASMTAVSGSIHAPASATKRPALIQLNQCEVCHARPPMCTSLMDAINNAIDNSALIPTPIQIGQCDCPLSHLAPKNPEISAPIKGSSGMRNE